MIAPAPEHAKDALADRCAARAFFTAVRVIVESVRFELDGRRIRTENLPPYALGGDTEGNYASFPISAGTHTLTAIPFGANNAGGRQGVSKSVTFEVVD